MKGLRVNAGRNPAWSAGLDASPTRCFSNRFKSAAGFVFAECVNDSRCIHSQ